MMRAPKKKYVTPAGVAQYPWLNKPDSRSFDGKPVKPAFKVNLIVGAEESEELRKTIDLLVEASYQEAIERNAKNADVIQRAFPYAPEKNDDGSKTGNFIFKLKQSAFIPVKEGEPIPVKIHIFDAAKKPLDVAIYGGSVIKASFTVRTYYMASTKSAGICLDLNAVQVLELVTSTQRSADSFGFGDEDGFVAEETVEEADVSDF